MPSTSPPDTRAVIGGPDNVTGVSETESRRRIFSCYPESADEERACAEEIVERLATKAYRRPLADRDFSALMSFYEEGGEGGGFEVGIRPALQVILASPHFVFRFEEPTPGVAPGEDYRISDHDLASRVSFFLWGTPPDEELMAVASRGDLSDPARLEEQVRRMLAHHVRPRSRHAGR